MICSDGSRWRQWPIWIAGRLRWLHFTREGIRAAERELCGSFNGILEFAGASGAPTGPILFLWLGLLADEPTLLIAGVAGWIERIEEKGWYWLWEKQLRPLPWVYAWMLRPFRPKEDRRGRRGGKSCPM